MHKHKWGNRLLKKKYDTNVDCINSDSQDSSKEQIRRIISTIYINSTIPGILASI